MPPSCAAASARHKGGIIVKVSVIVPVYNMEKYLGQCMDSLQGQTISDYEIICVDDGSTDSSLAMLREREKADNRVRVYTQKNSYAGVARNNGIAHATGEYLCFLDSDDFYEKDMLERMYDQAVRADADLCACLGDLYHNDTGAFSPFQTLNLHLTPKREAFRARDMSRQAFRVMSSAPSNKMIRRSLIDQYGLRFQSIRNVEDLCFIDLCVALAKRITVVDGKVLYHYRVNQTTNLQSVVYKHPLCCVEAMTALKEGLKAHGLYPAMKPGYDNLAAYELERYAVKLSQHPESFQQLHDWYHADGRQIYDISLKNLDAGTLSNLMMTFEGVTYDMSSEAVRERLIANRQKYGALYEGHKAERAQFLRRRLVALEGFPKGTLRWLGLIGSDLTKKLKNRA